MELNKAKDEGPAGQFGRELDALIAKWGKKPEDDRLTAAEMVGMLTMKAHMLTHEVAWGET